MPKRKYTKFPPFLTGSRVYGPPPKEEASTWSEKYKSGSPTDIDIVMLEEDALAVKALAKAMGLCVGAINPEYGNGYYISLLGMPTIEVVGLDEVSYKAWRYATDNMPPIENKTERIHKFHELEDKWREDNGEAKTNRRR
jgi:hypothetical protein